MTPSTPRRSSFPRTERSLTVQASTATPREWQRSTAARVISRWSSVVAATSASPTIASMRERKGQAQARAHGPEDGHEAAPPETEPARRIRPAERQAGLEPPQSSQLAETIGAGHRSPDEVVPPQGLDELALEPAALHVCQEPGLGALLARGRRRRPPGPRALSRARGASGRGRACGRAARGRRAPPCPRRAPELPRPRRSCSRGASAAAPRCPIRSSGPFPRRSETVTAPSAAGTRRSSRRGQRTRGSSGR